MSDRKVQAGPKGFIMIGDHGEGMIIDYSDNRSWLTLFYALPAEIVQKQREYLSIPRCPYDVLRTEEYSGLINDRLFLQLVWDSYAWAIWQCFRVPRKDGSYRGIPGIDLYYSGDFPLWRLAYYCVGAMREKFQDIGMGFQELYNLGPDQEVPYLTYEQWSNLIRNTTDQIITEQTLQPMIDEAWNVRTHEDYSEYYSKVKAAFEADWSHSRTKAGRGMQSLEKLMETSTGREQVLAVSDDSDFAEEVIYRLWYQRFLNILPLKDREILQLKTAGFTDQEIAERAGYKTHSAVVKRLRKIREKFEAFVKEDYRQYLESIES